MRGSSLFMATIGALPLIAFAATLFLSDGAPFRPYGSRHGAPEVGPRAPAAPLPAVKPPATKPRDAADDPAWNHLRRLAGHGDAEAALLLTILDPPRRRSDP